MPAFGPDRAETGMRAAWSGSPQLFRKVAVTVAVDPMGSVWLGGASVRLELGQVLPIGDHCVDSLVPLGQVARSNPWVLRTWPRSLKVTGDPSIVASTVGMIPSGVQWKAYGSPFGPMSEVSMWSGVGPVHPSVP